MKDNNEPRFKYELFSVMMGTRKCEHVHDILDKEIFNENDWEPQVYRSMATQIGDFERSRLSDSAERNKHLSFLSEKK
jgi:hypothetical protein